MAIRRRPDAVEDLDEIAAQLQRLAGAELAERFVNAAVDSFSELEAAPLSGGLLFYSDNPRLKDLRHRHVAGFRKYVIIYRPIDGGIEVVRVVSGRRNIAALFGTG